jgi:hypothetical protein
MCPSSTTMATCTIHTTVFPRFLLPQLTWCSRAIRPAALGALEARRHRSSLGPKQRVAGPVSTALQRRPTRQKATPHLYAGASALEARRPFSASAPQLKDHHFDTLKFVQRLKEEGFTEEQAEGMMRILGDVIEERCVL